MVRSQSGSSAAEFALVLPLFLIMLFGIIDAGRFMWEFNRAEKATQVGARVAVVTNVLSAGLHDEAFAGQTVNGTKIANGGRIPAGALGTMVCSSTGCSCETQPCPAAWDSRHRRPSPTCWSHECRQIDPSIAATNVRIRYSGSGMGFAGNAGSSGTGEMEISPLITVSALPDLQFTPITTFLLASMTMPDFATTLTAEDASGSYSN